MSAVHLLLLVVMVFQIQLVLPQSISILKSFGLFSNRVRFTNYIIIGLVAYGLYASGFTILESLVLGCLWMLLAAYLVFDYMYDVPLVV